VSDFALAAVLGGTILVASTISVEIGLSVALIELAAGVVVGNVFHPDLPSWLSFIGSFAGIVLTFLAGAEVDVPQFRREWRASISIGAVSFFAPFLVAGAFAYWALDWNVKQAEIGGIALSTTSLAVVYAVLVETGLNQELVGKRLMSATFVTDLGTAAALSILFIKPNLWILPFALLSVILIVVLPRVAPWFFGRYGDRVIEPEIKLVFASLLLLMWLGDRAHSHAVLPTFVLGLVLANHYAEHKEEQVRLRVVAFAFLTPLFFLKGGLNVSLGAVWANVGSSGSSSRRRWSRSSWAFIPAAVHRAARRVHDPVDVNRSDLWNDQLALRTQRRDHRPNAVLLVAHRRRAVGDRADCNRAAVLPAAPGARARASPPRRGVLARV
jgi:Kef-type K+ transport system membrane component KefB